MRDIFGVDIRQGDTMELHCLVNRDDEVGEFVEFVPIIREHNYRNYDGINIQNAIKDGNTYCFCLGKVWVTPIHGPFNGNEVNIVSHKQSDEDRFGNNFHSSNPMEMYKNIEVELSPSFLCHQGRAA